MLNHALKFWKLFLLNRENDVIRFSTGLFVTSLNILSTRMHIGFWITIVDRCGSFGICKQQIFFLNESVKLCLFEYEYVTTLK